MGRDFVTFEEASKLLNCTRRSVQNYVNRGQLRRTVVDGVVLLTRDDVLQLAEERGSELPALNNKTLLMILGKLKALEMKVSVFQKMNGIDLPPPLRPTKEEAQNLLEHARYYLKRTSVDSAEVDYWTSVLGRMDELTFELIRRETGDTTFWQDFFNLCISLSDYVSDPKRGRKGGNWLRHTMELQIVMKNLRALCLIWVELGKGSATPALTRQLRTGKDDLIRRITG